MTNKYLLEHASKQQLSQFERYLELLLEWNQKMNLTAITDADNIRLKHFVDSIMLLDYWDISSDKSIIDVGCGAGFPSIPLKIMLPDVKFVLVDSLNKRIGFLQAVVDELGLENITLVHGRAEDIARKAEYREGFDYAVARAVSNMATLSEYCLPFVKVDGEFIAYKSSEIEEELSGAKKAISLLGGKIIEVKEYVLPETDMGRSLVRIAKNSSTPKSYPRKAGMPAKNPLGVVIAE